MSDAPGLQTVDQRGIRAIWRLIVSDYEAGYAYKGEDTRRLRQLMLPRLLTNTSLHANVLFRLMVGSPAWMAYLWRRIIMSQHACDIGRDITIGPGLELPHPFAIAIGSHSHIGANVCIHHGVSIGPVRGRWVPGQSDATITIEDEVVLYPYCQVLGMDKIVGVGAQVGALQVLTDDLPAGAMYARGRVRLPSDRLTRSPEIDEAHQP